MFKLAWDPSAAYLNQIYSAVYPHLSDLTVKLFSFLIRHTQIRIPKPSQEHSRGSPEFPNKKFRQIGPGVPEL